MDRLQNSCLPIHFLLDAYPYLVIHIYLLAYTYIPVGLYVYTCELIGIFLFSVLIVAVGNLLAKGDGCHNISSILFQFICKLCHRTA